MGSYTPPPAAGVTLKIQEFNFTQTAEMSVPEVLAAPKKIKTIRISDIPLDAAGQPIPIPVCIKGVTCLGKKAAAENVHLHWSQYNDAGARIADIFGDSAFGASYVPISNYNIANGLVFSIAGSAVMKVILDAWSDSAAPAGALKNINCAIQLVIPQGATVTES